MTRRLKNLAKTALHRLFLLGQRLGLDILPRHFYSDIPDIRQLRATTWWRKPLSMHGIAGTDLNAQLEFVRQCCPVSLREQLAGRDVYRQACEEHGTAGFGPIEAEVLFGFIYTHRPKRVVQVGAGVSSSLILAAAREAGQELELICVDPHPSEYLRVADRKGLLRLVAEPAQTVDLNILTGVGERGVFFVDSTHTTKVGSEVNRLIQEVLPRLPAETIVHFHDIHFPYDYGRDILNGVFFGRESSFLHAFLLCNARYRILASLSMLHYGASGELQRIVPNYRPAENDDGIEIPSKPGGHFPSSIYLKVSG